jgi:hypothetical protein
MMNDSQQKMGGIAALIAAATFVVGLALSVTILAPYATGHLDPGQTVAFLADNQAIMYMLNVIVYVVFGIFLVVLSLALYERLKAGSPAMVQTATAFGLIQAALLIAVGMVFNIGLGTVGDLFGKDPALATSVWLAISSVQVGLSGGETIVASLWVLLLNWAALRAGGLPRALNYLGVVVGVAGLLTFFPALEVLFFVSGLGLLVWFVWLGIVMLRSSPSAAV